MNILLANPRGFCAGVDRAIAIVEQALLQFGAPIYVRHEIVHNIDALKRRFPTIVGPKRDDICYATQNRQDAVKFMAPRCDVIIVVGSPDSSNSNRLREVAANLGTPAYMIDRADEMRSEWLVGKRHVGVTAGASAPEVLVREVIARLAELGVGNVTELDGVVERVVFPMPKGLAVRVGEKAL